MNKLILALALLSPAFAHAGAGVCWSGRDWVLHCPPGYWHPQPRPVPNCIHSQTFVTGSSTEIVSGCEILRPIRMANKPQYYPNLRGNNFNVDYWDGAYGYRTRTYTTYQTVVSNDCRGETLSSDSSVAVSEDNREFAVANPNLDPEIKLSFELSPMLPEEASEAFTQALATCNHALPRK